MPALDMIPRLIPERMFCRGAMASVGQITTHPPGQHPSDCPLIPQVTAVRVQTDRGVRWFGCERAFITSTLRMAVVGTDPRDEVRMRWEPAGSPAANRVADLDEFNRAYVEAMLWSTSDEDETPLEANHKPEDLAPEALDRVVADCAAFLLTAAGDVVGRLEQAGHDFWLTRNGHGCGFEDGDWPADVGKRLGQASDTFGELYPYVGDDGLIYL